MISYIIDKTKGGPEKKLRLSQSQTFLVTAGVSKRIEVSILRAKQSCAQLMRADMWT